MTLKNFSTIIIGKIQMTVENETRKITCSNKFLVTKITLNGAISYFGFFGL